MPGRPLFRNGFAFYALLCFSSALLAAAIRENAPVKSRGALTFYLDTASFRAGSGKTHQEFYYQIALDQLGFHEAESGLRSEIKTTVLLADSTGRELLRDDWTQTVQAASAAEIAGRFFPNQFELPLTPGRYQLALVVLDIATQKQGSANLNFEARAFAGQTLALSDIQLANSIAPDTAKGRFTKNGYSVLPNAGRMYGRAAPLLYFYFEVYNFAAADSYEVHYSIRNSRDEVFKHLPSKIARKPGASSVEVGGVNLGSLADSTCYLRVEVKDRANRAAALATKSFFVVLPPPKVLYEVDQKISAMSPEQLKNHIDQIQYLLREDDKKLLQDLEPEAQKSFVAQVWKQFDSNPATPSNEFWDEYFRRVAYANEKFTSGFTTGWKTDRGRIAMKFGLPNEVERYPAETNARPYEVWYYYSEGRKQFIFADLEGLGRYELIYSSDERELTRPDWKIIINAQ